MQVRGRNGVRLEDLWARDGARAYLGTMLPGFLNFFMVYGPNTNVLANMQIVDMEEMVTRFALECIGALIEQRKQTVDVADDAYWRYNAEIDSAEKLMTYVDPRASNYYQNEHGRSASNTPLDTRLLWSWLRDPAGRRDHRAPLPLDDSLRDRFTVLDPRIGGDLIVE